MRAFDLNRTGGDTLCELRNLAVARVELGVRAFDLNRTGGDTLCELRNLAVARVDRGLSVLRLLVSSFRLEIVRERPIP